MTYTIKKNTQSMWENLFVVVTNKKTKRFNQHALSLNPMSKTI
jgi:hypothetical protein